MRIQLLGGVVLVVLIGAIARPARAEVVNYTFNGTVINADSHSENPNPLGINVIIGQSISGVLRYELDVPGTVVGTGPDGLPNRILYQSPRNRLGFSTGGVTVRGQGEVSVGNNAGSQIFEPTVDTFVAGMSTETPSPLEVVMRLEDTTQAVFSSAELPKTVPTASFELRAFEIYQILSNGFSHRYLTATIRSFTQVGRDVSLDIRPGSIVNHINPQANNTVPVAILTGIDPGQSNVFNATSVNPMSVRFGGIGREIAPLRFRKEDVDFDGDTDLLLEFKSSDIGLSCVDATATLRGETRGGRVVQGTDSVKVVGCD